MATISDMNFGREFLGGPETMDQRQGCKIRRKNFAEEICWEIRWQSLQEF